MLPIRKRMCLQIFLLVSMGVLVVITFDSFEVKAQTGANGNDANTPENQAVLAMDAANYGSADLALFYLLTQRWFPNPAKDPGYRGAAGTDRFRLEKGNSAELWLVPVEAFDPDDGTVSLGWNIWSDDGGILIDGIPTSNSSPLNGSSGNLSMHQYTVTAPNVEIVQADVTQDDIQIRLEPSDIAGILTIELTGTDTHTIWSEWRSGSTGILRETFDMNNLAVGEYERIKATWAVGGVTVEDEFEHHFKVLGIYEHTQYNTPHESDPTCQTGGAGNACNADQSCTYTPVTYVGAEFVDEVYENGSGVSIDYGVVKPAEICWNPCPRSGYPTPPECEGHVILRPNAEPAVTGKCNQPIDNTSVAVGDGNVDGLVCGNQVFIVGLGDGIGTVKTVRDRCPDCSDEDDERHLDHYNSDIHICDDESIPGEPLPTFGDMLTIQLFEE